MRTTPIIIYRGPPKNNSWARWMVNRTMRKNQNNLVAVVGKTGSGKTLSAISICEMMAKMDGVPFTIDHIVFSLRDLMELINSNKLKRGSKIIFDEPQVSISARDFQSEANKVFNLLVSTFRHRNLTLFFCTPFETLLDKNTRKLFHARFETMSINSNTQTCKLKPRYVEYSDWKADPYRKQLIVQFKDEKGQTRTKKLFHWDIPRPTKELEEQYEEKKLEFTNNLNKNISERLKRFDERGKSLTMDAEQRQRRKPLTERQLETMKTIAKHKYLDAAKILGISMGAISQNRKLAELKGYTVQEFKEEAIQNG